MMATPRESRIPRLARQARRSLDGIDKWIAEVLDSPCPHCGKYTLTIEDRSLRTAIVIYCEATFCAWKPRLDLKK